MGAAEALEPILRALAARCLRVPPEALDPAAPLARYGLDSLSAVELGVAISEATGLELAEDVLLDAPSIAELVQVLSSRPPSDSSLQARLQAMHADALLSADIDPLKVPAARGTTVLLTGATGFVGAHLVATLLDEGAGDIVCLARASSDRHALDRVRAGLRRYGVAAATFDQRVRALAADICQPALGLAPQTYAALANEVGAVFHCAAEVNWALPYDGLRRANVGATEGLLRFACTASRKDFHFVSSVAACYSTRGCAVVTETSAAPDLEGIHLGYAQSKWVAERLVDASVQRGLPATIYRPSLIAGDSASGIGNDEDFLALMLRGCIALGFAPALDWQLDACPVDFVTRAIARVALARSGVHRAVHLRNPRAVHWTEAALWLNLRGYRVVLEPFDAWIERVERCSREPSHPLHRLRGFLLHRPQAEGGRYLPQLYADPNVARLDAAASDAALARLDIDCPRLGAALFERYFDVWVARGVLPDAVSCAPSRRRQAGVRWDAAIETALKQHFIEPGLRISCSLRRDFGSEHSILGELASWRAGADLALHARSIELEHVDGRSSTLELAVKPKLPDVLVLEVTADIAAQCDPALGEAFGLYAPWSELAAASKRESAIYAAVSSALRAHSPACYGVIDDGATRALLLERVQDVELIDSVNRPSDWVGSLIEAALSGIAQVHAEWLGREADLSALCAFDCAIGGDSSAVATSWWRALAAHARPWLVQWLGEGGATQHAALAVRALEISSAIDAHPRTLIHYDFNPRNLALRRGVQGPQLCAFDWELAAYGLPQRDLAELLCFVLAPSAQFELMEHWVAYHRRALEAASGVAVDVLQWQEGLRIALVDFGVRRLPMYFIAHRFRPQAYLERVTRTWYRLATLLGVV